MTERGIIRDRRTRRFGFSVRMFIASELQEWLLQAGFAAVESCHDDGARLTAQSRRMITIAHR